MFMEIRYQDPIRLRPNQRELQRNAGMEAIALVRAGEGHARIMGVWRSGIKLSRYKFLSDSKRYGLLTRPSEMKEAR